MYLGHFGLQREPFSIAPDPRFLFISQRHAEARAHLRYGLQGSGGLVVLSGEIGAGKTTLCRSLLDEVAGEGSDVGVGAADAHRAGGHGVGHEFQVAYLFNPRLTERELLQSVCADFGIAWPQRSDREPTSAELIDALNRHLLANHAQGKRSVLMVDEAQALSTDLLEQLRLLTNLETHERKLLQIALIGQPELRDRLALPELQQLAQRVVARFHLGTLAAAETPLYIQHRLQVAGLEGASPFEADALPLVHELSGGVPRRINLLCDRALLGAYAEGRSSVARATVQQAANEVFGETTATRSRPTGVGAGAWLSANALLGLTALVAVATGAALSAQWLLRERAPVVAAAAAVAQPTADKPPATALASPAAGTAAPPSAQPSVLATTGAASATPGASPAALDGTASWLDAAALARQLPVAPAQEEPAWRGLAMAWLLTPLEGDVCDASARTGVHCLKRRGTLALLQQLDRPALLPLYGADGVARYVLLQALGTQAVRVQIGTRSFHVTPALLATLWRGEFGLLWRAPPGYRPAEGTRPARVDAGWLAAQLEQWAQAERRAPADGAAAASTTTPAAPLARPPGEARLRALVRNFQQAQGLDVDGHPGVMTLMALNRAVGVAEPRLAH